MKMKRLNYTFGETGISGVDVGFEDWTNQSVQYNITVRLTADEADLITSTPQQLADVAKTKIQAMVNAE